MAGGRGNLGRRRPNEDVQSKVFDASNLLAVDKFSGYDREGGGRTNVGIQGAKRGSVAAA
ncbi:LPS assembly protein LptD [Bradyrhizobium sp. BWA-3-5]|uniref:LPS assembly protein LptD n=1 Tax=Bradyrhizobium sp. BWA-3-5 TaxID=3080013 RepID=UPI00293E80AB|nr:LPS assembly protein LptD [Bradyrhizobium sp. BWA-3-5]WOH63816.1 LPS assembly protein LptD [Bradyrhizobium sp. BWA-3-5]